MNVCHIAGCLIKLAIVVVRIARYHRPYLNLLWRFVASEAELSSYAGSKLDEITDINSIRAKGTYQNYDFIIIRIDRFEQWVANDPLASFDYSNDGYAVVSYERTTSPFSSLPVQQLHMYKDPLDKFIIITNCNDNKVITDFF